MVGKRGEGEVVGGKRGGGGGGGERGEGRWWGNREGELVGGTGEEVEVESGERGKRRQEEVERGKRGRVPPTKHSNISITCP